MMWVLMNMRNASVMTQTMMLLLLLLRPLGEALRKNGSSPAYHLVVVDCD